MEFPMTNILGIDISKQYLDMYDLEKKKHLVFPNTSQGIEEIISLYQGQPLQVILESTGVYQRLAHQLLERAGFKVCVVNPYKSRCFAKGAGYLAKTDKVDAKMLAHYGKTMDLKPTPYPSPGQEKLESLVSYKDHLVTERGRTLNYLEQSPSSDHVQDLVHTRLKQLDQEIKSIQHKIEELIESNETFRHKRDILITVPGISGTTIAILLAHLKPLGQANRQQIAALVGLAPMTCESGAYRGRAMIRGGKKAVRKALYMPILSALRCNQIIRALYNRLKDAGKPSKVALVAAMRKLLIILNTMIKNNQPWRY
jgi:transposase